MRLEDYTSDAICRAMSLSGFIEPSWTEAERPTLRVVLTPSFHPELCITVADGAGGVSLSVVALAEKFSAPRADIHLPTNREQSQLSSSVFQEVSELFQAAHAAFDSSRRYVCVDGMGSESCLVSRAGTQRLHAHVSGQATGRFIARLIDVAWSGGRDPRVRNALARAASYLEIKYPLDVLPPEPLVTRLAVLGTPDDRRDYLEMLRRRKKEG